MTRWLSAKGGCRGWHRSAGTAFAGLCLFLTACQTPAPQVTADGGGWPDLASEYRREGVPAYRLDPARSKLRLYVYRAGAAARLGHNHVLTLPAFEGYVRIPGERPEDAGCELRAELTHLVVDDPAVRAETGGAFASPRSAADIEGTRRNMLGDKGLDAERYPQVRLRCVAVSGDWPQVVAQVEVTLHGVRRLEPVALQVERSPAGLRVQGTLLLRQSDYGITPFSVLGGLMAVQNEILVRFDLRGRRLSPPSRAGDGS